MNIDEKASMSAGAGSVDLLKVVHPSYLDVATSAVDAIPGLAVAGVDILASDLRRPAQSGNHIIIEINSMPGLGSHHFPGVGEARDAAGAILDHLNVNPIGRLSGRDASTEASALSTARRRPGRTFGIARRQDRQ